MQTTYIIEDVRCFIEVKKSKENLKINKCCSIMPRVGHYIKLFFGLPSTKTKPHMHILLV